LIIVVRFFSQDFSRLENPPNPGILKILGIPFSEMLRCLYNFNSFANNNFEIIMRAGNTTQTAYQFKERADYG